MPSRRTALLSATLAAASSAKAMVMNLPITFRESYAVAGFSLGDPASAFAFQLDTGSATSWVIDSSCGSSCRPYFGSYNRTTYSFYGSHSANGTGIWGYIDYLGGYASGPGVRDVWSVPSSSVIGSPSQNASNDSFEWEQTFMSIMSSSMTYGPASGLMGLAFSSIADAGATTVVETLMWDGLLYENKFALYYGTEVNDTIFAGDTVAHNGVLTIGSSCEDEFVEGDMTTVPIRQQSGQYQVWSTNLFRARGSRTVGEDDTEEHTIEQNGAWAVFDTGSGRMVAPPSVVEDLYASIGMNWTAILHGHTIPRCRDFNSSWSVTLELGLVDGEQVELELTGDLFVEPGFAYQEDACWPPFDSGDVEGFWLIGSPFLQKVYSVWDFGGHNVSEYEPTVSFGRLREEYEPTEMRKFE